MRNEQYLTDARNLYPEFDTFSELDQQRVLNDLCRAHKEENPLTYNQLRKQHYKDNKRVRDERVYEENHALKVENLRLGQELDRFKEHIKRLEREIIRLKLSIEL